MIFKKRKHPLPKFPESVIPTFRQLCEAVESDEAQELIPEVDKCMAHFQRLKKKHENMNLQLAYEIADRCRFLLDHYDSFTEEQQSLIMGAVRYFAIADDALSETAFASGFHDDAKVMNYVLEELDLLERVIAL
ncbi:MAG: hypothetical protein KDD64_06220 [Bdellovibrionales bacterium]|nr:hypothetical protein [Bdellovibrionales bacterium]